jgi:hypothetical protein
VFLFWVFVLVVRQHRRRKIRKVINFYIFARNILKSDEINNISPWSLSIKLHTQQCWGEDCSKAHQNNLLSVFLFLAHSLCRNVNEWNKRQWKIFVFLLLIQKNNTQSVRDMWEKSRIFTYFLNFFSFSRLLEFQSKWVESPWCREWKTWFFMIKNICRCS